MPRPSKRVAPDTLGGKLRSARQNLHLSLADVAGDRYSTSLISQIERNRVDPSAEGLQYLAERLHLSHEALQAMVRQHRESETEATFYREYEATYAEISQVLTDGHIAQALALLESTDLAPERFPSFLRWRILALRGQAHFARCDFARAQRDFRSSLALLPAFPSPDQALDVLMLRLCLAEATRELGQGEQALADYRQALKVMDSSTALHLVAEAYRGMALVFFEQGRDRLVSTCGNGASAERSSLFQTALQHANQAHALYAAAGDHLSADLMQDQMAHIELAEEKRACGKERLQQILATWQPVCQAEQNRQAAPSARHATIAELVAATACALADLERQEGHGECALALIEVAVQAGQHSTPVRRAAALLTKGLILETCSDHTESAIPDPAIEQCYRRAIEVLEGTGKQGCLAQAHAELGRYLLTIGRREEGEREIERGCGLTGLSGRWFSAKSVDPDA